MTEELALQRLLEERIGALDRLFTQRMDDSDRAVAAALTSAKDALTVALTAAKEKAEQHNQLIGHMKEQSATMLTRAEATLMREQLTSTVADLTARIGAIENRRIGIREGWGYLAGLIGIIVALWAVLKP